MPILDERMTMLDFSQLHDVLVRYIQYSTIPRTKMMTARRTAWR